MGPANKSEGPMSGSCMQGCSDTLDARISSSFGYPLLWPENFDLGSPRFNPGVFDGSNAGEVNFIIVANDPVEQYCSRPVCMISSI